MTKIYRKNIYYLFLLIFLFGNPLLFAQNQRLSCGVDDKVLSESTLKAMRMAPALLAEKKNRKTASELYVCRIAIDIDSDTYNYFDKDTARIRYELIKTIEKVSKIYEKEINTRLVVTHINIWKDQRTDPYYGVLDIFQLLSITFNKWSNAPFKDLPFDKVMYLPTKSFTGAGGVAHLNGLPSVSPWGDVKTIAHELGHNFGSPHTQSCYWPGGPLDFCYPAEEDCYREVLEIIRGTIMSYCGDTLTFHPFCQVLMQQHAESKFKKLSRIVSPPQLPETLALDGNPFIFFNPVVLAEGYYYQLSQTSDFKEILNADSTSINALLYSHLKKSNTYYLRVKARNRFGESAWSNTAAIIIQSNMLLAPRLKISPDIVNSNGNLFIERSGNHEMPIELDNDATGYEVRVYNAYGNFTFQNPVISKIYNSNEIFFLKSDTSPLGGGFFWHVRAIKNNVIGPWSDIQKVHFTEADDLVRYPISDTENTPLNFPITYVNQEMYDVKFTLSASNDFTNPLLEKVIKPDKYSKSYNTFSLMTGELKPNTRYFLKIEAIPPIPDIAFENSGPVFRTIIKTFHTRSRIPSDQSQFFKHENMSNLGRSFDKFFPVNGGIVAHTESGISRVDINSLKAEAFDRDNTNGMISNRIILMNVDSLGNLWAVMPLSKRTGGYDGAFPKPVFALRQFDGKSMALLSSEEFVIEEGYSMGNLDANYKLITTDKRIGTIEKGVWVPLIDLGNQLVYINKIVSSKSYVWIHGWNSSRYFVFRYTKATKELKDVSINEWVNDIVVDKAENLWVSNIHYTYANAIGKYDGKNWTVYRADNSPSNEVYYGLCLDKFDNVYVRSSIFNSIYRFDGKNWETTADNSGINKEIRKMLVDELGKVWSLLSNNALMRIDPCKQMPKPSIVSNTIITDLPKPVVLEAKGCTSVIWNWQNEQGSAYERLVSGSNKIEVIPTKTVTTYYARCYDNGCSGEESNFMASLNIFKLNKVVKDQICEGDSVSVLPQISGSFGNDNQLVAILYSSNKHYRIPIKSGKDGLAFKTDASMPKGKYWLKIASSSPEIVSGDSLEVTLLSLPSVSIIGKSNICVPEKVSLFAKVTEGTAPYNYLWTQGENRISIDNDTLSGLDQQATYHVSVTDSNGCTSSKASQSLSKIDLSGINITADGQLLSNTSVSLAVPAGYNYQWYKNNIVVAGATQNTFIVIDGGTYKVDVNMGECKVERSLDVSVITGNEMSENNETGLKVFPNPSDGNFVLEFTLSDNKPAELSITDVTGKVIWEKKLKTPGKHIERINLATQPSGTYLVLLTKNQQKQTLKLVRQ